MAKRLSTRKLPILLLSTTNGPRRWWSQEVAIHFAQEPFHALPLMPLSHQAQTSLDTRGQRMQLPGFGYSRSSRFSAVLLNAEILRRLSILSEDQVRTSAGIVY